MKMDRPAFNRLLLEQKDAVYGLAVHLLDSREEAQDVVQDVFLKLWRKGGAVEVQSRTAWLLRVCRNACLDRLRRRKVRRHHRADPSQIKLGVGSPRELDGDSGRELSFDLSDEGAGAQQVEDRSEVRRIVAAMQRLSEPQRSIIMMRELQGFSYEEIASTTELSLSAVKVSLHRARKKVRRMFEEAKEVRA
ncbi:MAG TPA: RNA polymerase sigma factor [Candidatus Krumholzibacteria bacterium]|nr:RNA polymerase sigma factor [Candidatus Krumholzibacteria bacterium]